MNELPNPLTPADCDLSGYTWMPLDVVRVIDSDTFGLSTGDEFKTAFRLWAKSWLQVPAASLPDDDRLLAHLSGLELPAWKKRKAVALRGFIKCSDGRLYHPVIAAKAIEAMGKREAREEREENEQTRQERYRQRRRALFELLRSYGIVPDAKTKMDELERLVASLPASPSVTSETQSVTTGVTGETHGDVTNDASATANTRHESTGQDITKTLGGTSHAIGTPLRASPAQLSAVMRRHSIEAQPGNPKIIAAAEAGVTVETVEAACAEAKSKKQGQRINAGYVISIAQAWTLEAAAPRPAGSARPQSYHDERADVIAQLTGRKAAHQPDYDGVIDVDAHAIPRLGT